MSINAFKTSSILVGSPQTRDGSRSCWIMSLDFSKRYTSSAV